jgi:uncharacterized membrane protein YccC
VAAAARVNPVQWLARRDRGFGALRRAARTAIVTPALFAIGMEWIGNADVATFAAFGSFAMLLLVDFSGPLRERLQAQVALALVGGGFVCLGTLASRAPWLATVTMGLVAFAVLFAGVVSSVLASASTSLLLALILPVSRASPASTIPDRLLGWGIASAAALAAVAVLWPSPSRGPLRAPAIAACRALAARLRSEVAYLAGGDGAPSKDEHDRVVAGADAAVGALHRTFLATPYRPTSLSTPARAIVRLVDELTWLNTVMGDRPMPGIGTVSVETSAVKTSAAETLERGADVLERPDASTSALRSALDGLRSALDTMERDATIELPERASDLVNALDPSFRAQELSFGVLLVARNIDLTVSAEQRSWWQRVMGRQPAGIGGPVAAAQERAVAHFERHSVWLHNSVRGAIALGLAVLVANKSGVQHSFWVILGTLSVLRSNALNTGQFIARAILGTAIGFALGAAIVELIGTDRTLLWVLLPLVVLFAGIAPAAISFAAGQAAFTLTLLILYNLVQPAGWRLGIIRVEDVAIGFAVSLAVGLLFWPRGAAAALRQALGEAYADSAHYLDRAVEFGLRCCGPGAASPAAPTLEAGQAAAASRRLDDAFRTYLAERGAKPVPLAEVTGLVSGVASLRLTADAVLDLWRRDPNPTEGDRDAARAELRTARDGITRWYGELAASLAGGPGVPDPAVDHEESDTRFVWVRQHDLIGRDGGATATAVRMIWTGDHLDAARRLQATLAEPARATTDQHVVGPFAGLHAPWRTARSLPRGLAGSAGDRTGE